MDTVEDQFQKSNLGISPEQAQAILQKNGLKTTIEQSILILNFLYYLANVALTQYMKNVSSGFIHQSKH